MSTQPSTQSDNRRRRRKQGNPLLPKIVGGVILFHIIFLPIAAKYGAFKAVQRHLMDVQMVNLPPPAKEKTPPKTETKKAPQKVAHRGPAATHAHTGPVHQNLTQPHVVAGPTTTGGNGDGGPTVDPNGTGPAGRLPTVATATPTPKPPVVTTPPPVSTPTPAPPVAVATPRPATPTPPPATPTPHVPVYVEAQPIESPHPSLPDTLRGATLDATAIAEFTVGADGTPTEVRIVTSAGNHDLDQLVLDAARRWRFKPAERDGQPVASVVRLHVEFQVI